MISKQERNIYEQKVFQNFLRYSGKKYQSGVSIYAQVSNALNSEGWFIYPGEAPKNHCERCMDELEYVYRNNFVPTKSQPKPATKNQEHTAPSTLPANHGFEIVGLTADNQLVIKMRFGQCKPSQVLFV